MDVPCRCDGGGMEDPAREASFGELAGNLHTIAIAVSGVLQIQLVSSS
jgi:hypothetical protein